MDYWVFYTIVGIGLISLMVRYFIYREVDHIVENNQRFIGIEQSGLVNTGVLRFFRVVYLLATLALVTFSLYFSWFLFYAS